MYHDDHAGDPAIPFRCYIIIITLGTLATLMYHVGVYIELQGNPSIPDTLGTVLSVLIEGGVLILWVVLYTSLHIRS